MARFYPGQENTEITRREAASRALARRAAAEGMVLLENNGILPLHAGAKIALFGNGATDTVKGGTGSGDVNARNTVSVLEGLRNAGFRITSEAWLSRFAAAGTKAKERWKEAVYAAAGPEKDARAFYRAHASLPVEWPELPIRKEDVGDASAVVYVISRISGEGADRREEKGDYYLSETEERHLTQIAQVGVPLILLLNVGGIIDLSFLDRIPVSALLLMSQAGSEGGNAAADLLAGSVSPSGRLTDTWAFHYRDYPSADTFGIRSGNLSDAYYYEGIYVGYRYFDSFGVPVRYPFGYGLSYTTFSLSPAEISLQPEAPLSGPDSAPSTFSGPAVLCRLRVTNTGGRPGRQVVQLYVSCPSGELPVEEKRLVCFGKTTLLQPGGSQELELSFPLSGLTVYDEGRAAYLLQKGTYRVLAGENAASVRQVGSLLLRHDVVTEQLTNICEQLDALKELRAPERADKTGFPGVSGTKDVLTDRIDITAACDRLFCRVLPVRPGRFHTAALYKKAAAIADQMTDQEKASLVVGARSSMSREEIGNAALTVPGAAGQTVCFPQHGIPAMVLADGPAGIRVQQQYETDPETGDLYLITDPFALFENRFFGKLTRHEGARKHYQFATAFPIGTLLAQTFDLALLEEVGEAVAVEMEAFGVQIWLGPGMNIHRNPLCGRNYEYFSEDPVLTGETAAAITRGVQKSGSKGVCIKHFACNNQEDNRMHVTAVISERALREIYLKGFEIAVRKGDPASIMTSYNRINSVHAANSYDLCTTAARKEWGFSGFIMTDWTTTNGGGSSAAKCIAAGNDLVMPGRDSDVQEILDALDGKTQKKLSREELNASAERLIRAALCLS